VEYEPTAPDELPQDPSFTGEGWTFAPEEHDEISFFPTPLEQPTPRAARIPISRLVRIG
jgi:hypothetical protein